MGSTIRNRINRIKNLNLITERLICITDSFGARVDFFFLSDLEKREVIEFVPFDLLMKPLLKETEYVKDGVKVIQLMYL